MTLKEWLENKGGVPSPRMAVTDFAKAIGETPSHVRDLMERKRNISLAHAWFITQVTDNQVTLQELLPLVHSVTVSNERIEKTKMMLSFIEAVAKKRPSRKRA